MDDQISMFEVSTFVTFNSTPGKINPLEFDSFNIIKQIINNSELPSEYLTCRANNGYTSILVNNKLMCKIKFGGKSAHFLYVRENIKKLVNIHAAEMITKEPDDQQGEWKTIPSDTHFMRYNLSKPNDIHLVDKYIIIAFKIAYLAGATYTYDCCAFVEICSDQKKCVNEDKTHALSCTYKQKLENGIIFYGKNRNID